MAILSLQHFAAARGEQFALDLGVATMALALIEADPLSRQGAQQAGGLRQPFSLIFRAASPVVLPQKIYTLSNPTLGRLGIFLVPIGRDPGGVLYQAIFN